LIAPPSACGWWRTRCSRRRPGDPIDFESTIEKTLREWHAHFRLRQVLFDPYQMAAVAQRLAQARIPVEEYPQTLPNLTAVTSNLFDLISARQLVLYPDAEMRLSISRAIIVESARGWRLDKMKQQHKIDVVVALSMAALAAVRDGGKSKYDTSMLWVGGDETVDLHRQEQLAFNRYILAGGFR
jgi:phage terminase large subunit-like protein